MLFVKLVAVVALSVALDGLLNLTSGAVSLAIIPALIGGAAAIGGSLIGGKMASRATKSANDANAAALKQQNKLQKEFAQHGIRWKVEDAKKAGIAPLAALGAQTHSFSPASVGVTPDLGMANAAANMGQDISRAVHATRTGPERAMAVLQLENQKLQNDYLRSQIAKMNSSQVGPGLPSNSGLPGSLLGSGQGDAYVVEKPLERTHSAPGLPGQEVGYVPDLGWARTASGLTQVPSADVKQKIEDQLIPEVMWAVRNHLLPNLGIGERPSKDLLPKGAKEWIWNPLKQEYQPDTVYRDSWFGNKFGRWYGILE